GSVGLHRQHRARLHRLAVEQDGADAAVGGVAADVRAGQAQVLAQEVHEEQPGLDLELLGSAVHRHLDVVGRHGHLPPARSTASFSARAVSTRAISFLYSTVPSRSSDGDAASAALRAPSAMLLSVALRPVRNDSAAAARIGTGPALVSARPTLSNP